MNKILNPKEAIKTSKLLKEKGRKIVLAGGCFDILHIGHLAFLKKAKREGDILFVFLESDWNIKKMKGKNRPLNSQKDRSHLLSFFDFVDYVVILAKMTKDKDYDHLVAQIKPAIIATVYGDPNLKHKKRQAKMIGAKVVFVLKKIPNQSTSNLAKLIQ